MRNLVILQSKRKIFVCKYSVLQNYTCVKFGKMVTKKLLGAVLSGNILMVLAGASVVWPVLNIERMLIYSEKSPVIYLPFLVGQLLGCFLFGVLADLIGRRISLLILTAPYLFGFIISEFFYAHIVLLGIGRAVTGLAVGGAYVVLPVYIGEISDSKTRGSLVSIMFTSFLLGMFLVTGVFKYFDYHASILNIFCVLLAIIFAIVFGITAPESPVYYLKKGRDADAMISLEKLRNYKLNKEIELKDMKEKVHLNTDDNIDPNERVMVCANFPEWIKGLAMVFVLTISETLIVSVNSVAYYHFMQFDDSVYTIFVAAAGILELLCSCLCPILIDKIGRKMLLILSFGGSAIFLSVSTILLNIKENNPDTNLTLLMTIQALICRLCLVIGIAPIRFVLISELFPLKFKMMASAASNIFYLVSFQLSYFLQSYGFFSFMVIFISFVMTAIIKKYFLETNNKSLLQIQVILNGK